MREPLISIIVPVYNAEATLHKCFDSIAAQTLSDFEVIVVDDGSTDASPAMCDEYAAGDERFRVIHKENGGVSSARQVGIDNARGTYSIHVDPDDWIDPTMLQVLHECAEREQADVVICDLYNEVVNRKSEVIGQRPSAMNPDAVLREMFKGKVHGSMCNKLIRHRLYKDFGITFPIGINMWEDAYVCSRLLRHDVKVAYVPQAFYHYNFSNSNSITKHFDEEKLEKHRQLIGMMTEGLPADEYEAELLQLHVSLIYYGFRSGCSPEKFAQLFDKSEKQALRAGVMASTHYHRVMRRCIDLALCGHLTAGRRLWNYYGVVTRAVKRMVGKYEF